MCLSIASYGFTLYLSDRSLQLFEYGYHLNYVHECHLIIHSCQVERPSFRCSSVCV